MFFTTQHHPYFVLILLALTSLTHALPFSKVSYTPLSTISRANGSHFPNYGAKPAKDMPRPIVPRDANLLGRRLESSTSVDIDRLASFFNKPLILNVDDLQSKYAKGEMKTAPWPSSYCPMFQDSINYQQYGNEASPAEKYARAFGLNVRTFMDAVSRDRGIDSCDECNWCTDDYDCNGGERCGKRTGEYWGKCMPTWWGICHAWASAAIMETEPKCPVTVNGVKFRVSDIKNLLTMVYDGSSLPVVFTGARYDGYKDTVDRYGRYTDPTERDLCPAFLHVAVLNIMGVYNRSMIIDIAPTDAVWNQPVSAYSVSTPQRMKPEAAMRRFFRANRKYVFNPLAVEVAYTKMALSYMVEDDLDGAILSNPQRLAEDTTTVTYEYLLELDGKGNILGGEWVGNSKTNHPDFLWFVTEKLQSGTTAIGLDYANVASLLNQSLSSTC